MGQSLLQSGATIDKKPIHLCDTRTICLLIGSMRFESAVHSVHPPPPLSAGRRGVEPLTKIFKKEGGLTESQCFGFFQEVCSFYIKNKLKSEIFNDKNVYKQKIFSLS